MSAHLGGILRTHFGPRCDEASAQKNPPREILHLELCCETFPSETLSCARRGPCATSELSPGSLPLPEDVFPDAAFGQPWEMTCFTHVWDLSATLDPEL